MQDRRRNCVAKFNLTVVMYACLLAPFLVRPVHAADLSPAKWPAEERGMDKYVAEQVQFLSS